MPSLWPRSKLSTLTLWALAGKCQEPDIIPMLRACEGCKPPALSILPGLILLSIQEYMWKRNPLDRRNPDVVVQERKRERRARERMSRSIYQAALSPRTSDREIRL
jgi:hypothetical protein